MTTHTSSIKPADRRMVALVLVIVTVTLVALGFIFAQGSDTQRAVQLQHEGLERAECVTEYRTEWQNAVGDIVLVAARGNDPTPAQVRALARVQRRSSQVNQRCDATQPGGVRLPGERAGP